MFSNHQLNLDDATPASMNVKGGVRGSRCKEVAPVLVQPLCNRMQFTYAPSVSDKREAIIGPTAPRTFQLLAELVAKLVLPAEWDELTRRLIAAVLVRYFFNSDRFVECMNWCGSQSFNPAVKPEWGLNKAQLESLRASIRSEREYFHSKEGDVRWFTHHVPHNRSWDQQTSKHIGYVRELAESCLAWCDRIVDSDVDLRPAGRALVRTPGSDYVLEISFLNNGEGLVTKSVTVIADDFLHVQGFPKRDVDWSHTTIRFYDHCAALDLVVQFGGGEKAFMRIPRARSASGEPVSTTFYRDLLEAYQALLIEGSSTPVQELARRMSANPSTVKSWLRRGRVYLRRSSESNGSSTG